VDVVLGATSVVVVVAGAVLVGRAGAVAASPDAHAARSTKHTPRIDRCTFASLSAVPSARHHRPTMRGRGRAATASR
jgi:hypothetical protein